MKSLHERKLALLNRAKKRFPVIVRLPRDKEFVMIGNTLTFWYNDKNDSTRMEAESFCEYEAYIKNNRKGSVHEQA